ncbi:MAG: hypothetical protein H0U40_08550 [Chloroflexia bacterium]|nr:hypothetical protein [Chloroflexia bacterium]
MTHQHHRPTRPRDDPGGRSGRGGGLLKLIALLLVALVITGGPFLNRYRDTIDLVLRTGSFEATATTLLRSALDSVNEQPAFSRVPGAPEVPLCRSVTAVDGRALADAMNLMRRDEEGRRLFRQLLDEGICVGVEDIDYNTGYALARQSITGSWASSTIMVDRDMIDAGESDVLAALLVHEATHIDRFINGLACTYDDSCTTLPNGVDLDEEVAAHAAEAVFWRGAYDDDGKRFSLGYAYGMNQLLDAYLDGPDAFTAYVRDLRGDERESS